MSAEFGSELATDFIPPLNYIFGPMENVSGKFGIW